MEKIKFGHLVIFVLVIIGISAFTIACINISKSKNSVVTTIYDSIIIPDSAEHKKLVSEANKEFKKSFSYLTRIDSNKTDTIQNK